MDQQAGQHRMLDDIGEISSVKGMTVVHGGRLSCGCSFT
jgi:hypothetical protein